MDHTLEGSELSSSPLRDLGEPNTPGLLNRACLLNENDLLFDDLYDNDTHDIPPVIIPETPSPLCFRRRRRPYRAKDQGMATFSSSDTRRQDETKPSADLSLQQRSKRRRLHGTATSTGDGATADPCSGIGGFVRASSLMATDSAWLEPPRPSCSSSSSSSATSPSPSATSFSDDWVAREATCRSRLGMATSADSIVDPRTCSTGRAQVRKCKKAVSTQSSSKSSKSKSTPTSTVTSKGSPLPGAEEGRHVLHTSTDSLPSTAAARQLQPSAYQIQQEIIIIDEEEEEDVIVEAMVRSVQVAEDEAFARSLQEQFNREEQLQEEQRRLQASTSNRQHHHHHHPHPHPYNPYVGMDWINPWASMVGADAFPYGSQGLAELHQVMFGEPPGRRSGRSQAGRSRSNSRHRRARHVHPDIFDDSQGNNYEALLAFEDEQGTVSAKAMSKGEIDRLPTKAFDPAHSAGKTDCQICFCEYTEGEQLRMLPCLHDYHVKCIDRWLKENATCPICRADVTAGGGFT